MCNVAFTFQDGGYRARSNVLTTLHVTLLPECSAWTSPVHIVISPRFFRFVTVSRWWSCARNNDVFIIICEWEGRLFFVNYSLCTFSLKEVSFYIISCCGVLHYTLYYKTVTMADCWIRSCSLNGDFLLRVFKRLL